MKIKVNDPFLTPERGTEDSAGWDLRVAEAVLVPRTGRVLVKTGVFAAIPKGYVGLLIARSSLSKRGIILSNSVGVIDADYRGEILAPLSIDDMLAPSVGTWEGIQLDKYEKIVQLVVVPYYAEELQVVDDLDETTRGSGGFGSTGL